MVECLGYFVLPFVATCVFLYLAFLPQSSRKNLTEEIKRKFFEIIEMFV